MPELGGPLGRAQLKRDTKVESPKKRLVRLKAEAKEVAFVRGQMVPLSGASFGGFLRTGRVG